MKKKLNATSFYGRAEKYIDFNTDPDLEPIRVYLPEAPELDLIEGYGKPSVGQRFERAVMPQRLVELQRICKNTDEVWSTLDKQRLKYKEEINWIKKQWYYRLNGYWFYNCGIPTYIDGWHYFYLNYYKIDVGLPNYRDRDRKFFIFAKFCYTTTESFESLRYDAKGKQIPNKFGDKMIDLGRRTCAGFLYPKHRREGATYKAECINCEIMTRKMNANSGIQSMTDDHAEEVYRTKLLNPYLNLPFFFRPKQKGKIDTLGGLWFEAPIERVKGGSISIEQGLNSSMSYRSSDESAYDSFKLYFYHEDEIGKSDKIDVYKRHNIVKECLAENQGLDIIGFGIGTSTVGEMSGGGGENFYKLVQDSNFYNRTSNGITPSYYFNLFIPADEGFKVDEYGRSLKDISREHIDNQADKKLQEGDVEGWAEERRKYPVKFSDCFIQSAGGIGFDTYIIEKRLAELRFTRDLVRYGDLVRDDVNNIVSKVRFVDNPNGRFCLSMFLDDYNSNNYHKVGNTYRPTRDVINVGVDTFKFKGGISDGGITAKIRRDLTIDPMNKPISEWESDRLVLTYRYRPDTTDEFCDDALKVCQYFGAYATVEINIANVVDYFDRNGFTGFLKILKNGKGEWNKRAGIHLGETEKDDGFHFLRDYIKRRGLYERHIDFLKEAKNITKSEELTKYDLLASASMALHGERVNYDEIYGSTLTETDNTTVLRRKNYSIRRY